MIILIIIIALDTERLIMYGANMSKAGERSMITFQQIQDKVGHNFVKGSVLDLVDDVLDRARINANDTIYVEMADTEENFDKIAIASIIDILSYETNQKVINWFKEIGIVA